MIIYIFIICFRFFLLTLSCSLSSMDMTHLKKQIIFIILLALFCMIGVIVNHRYKDTSQPQNTVDSVYFDDTANVDSTVDSVSQPLEQPEQKDIPSKVSSQNDGI